MQILILILFIIIILGIIIIIYMIPKQKNMNSKDEEISNLKKDLQNSLNIINTNLNQQLSSSNMESTNQFKNATDSLDRKISHQSIEQFNLFKNSLSTLEQKILSQEEHSNKFIKEIIEKVSSLDKITTQISGLNDNINNLEKVLSDKKARGTFGEIKLLQIFEAVYGSQPNIYEEQYSLSNGYRVDFILHAPKPLGDISIDSKFPLENYLNIINSETEQELTLAKRNFKQDLKKHIDAIANKYIIEGETATQAIMFIPAESIFAEINGHHEDIQNYSYQKKVWIASPSTLFAILNLLLAVQKDLKREEAADDIYEELLKLKIEFARYTDRWDSLVKHMDMTFKDVKELSTTSNKISKRFSNIESVNFDHKE